MCSSIDQEPQSILRCQPIFICIILAPTCNIVHSPLAVTSCLYARMSVTCALGNIQLAALATDALQQSISDITAVFPTCHVQQTITCPAIACCFAYTQSIPSSMLAASDLNVLLHLNAALQCLNDTTKHKLLLRCFAHLNKALTQSSG